MRNLTVSRFGFCLAAAMTIWGCGGSNRDAPKTPLDRASTASVGTSAAETRMGITGEAKIALDSGPLVSVTVAAPDRAWAVASCGVEAPSDCIEGVFRSNDGGATWVLITSTVVVSPSFVDADHGWGILGNTEPGSSPAKVAVTRDGGRTWTPERNGCPARFGGPVALSFVDREHGWLACNYTFGAGGAAKGIVETTDGGRHWTVRSGVSADQGSVGSIGWSDYLTTLAMRSNGTGMWFGPRGTTGRTSSSGKSWTYGPPGDFAADVAQGVSLATDRTWFLLMWLGDAQETALERSGDAGRHWSIVGRLGAP